MIHLTFNADTFVVGVIVGMIIGPIIWELVKKVDRM